MSLIDTIFGTTTSEIAVPDDDGVVEYRTSIDKGRRRAKKGTVATTSSTTTSSENDNAVTNHQNHHSLFHTIIPIPDRKLEYNDKKKNDSNKNAKKHVTTTSMPPKKRQKNGDEFERNVDSDNEDEEEEEEEQHHTSNIHSDHENHEKNERTIFVGNIPITYTRKHLRQLFLDCGSIQSTRIRGIAILENDSDDVKNIGNKGRKAQNNAVPDVPNGKKSVVKLPPSLAGQQQIYKKVCINTSNNTMGIDTTKKQSNIGYVVFDHKDSVEKALLKNNMIVPVGPIPASSLLGTPKTTTPGGDLNNVRHIRVDRCTMTTATTTTNNASDHNSNPTLRDPKRTIFIGNLPYHTDEETLHQHILQHMKLDNIEKSSSSSSESMNDKNCIIESIRIVRNPTTYLCQGFAYVLFTSLQYVPTALRMLHQTTYMKQVLRIQACKTKTKNDHVMKQSNSSSSDSRTSTSPSLSTARSDMQEEHRATTRTRASTAPTTKAVGALKRVLQKQQRLLLQDNKKVKTIRKRGPTMSKHKITKKATSGSKKKKK